MSDDSKARSILLVSYWYPPCPDTGAHRPAALAKYLRAAGHRVTVLTSAAHGTPPGGDDEDVVRSYDLQLARAKLRGADRVEPVFGAGAYTGRPHPLSYVLVPEALVAAWVPFARRRALALHRERRFDCVITTSPPESAHLIGRALQRRGAAWVADLRDGWNFEPLRPRFPTAAQRRLDHRLERRLLGAADVVTCVTEAMAADARERLGARAAVVPSGFEPEAGAGAEAGDLLDPDRVSLVYTGRFAHHSRDPTFLIEALAQLARDEPALAARLELVFAGPYQERERALLRRDVAPARIRVVESLPRERALGLQREADALLLIASAAGGAGGALAGDGPLGAARPGAGSAKLFEYLGAGRPILALAAETEVGAVVRETGSGTVIGAADTGAIKEALRSLASGKMAPAGNTDARGAYAYPRIAARMAEQVETAIARAHK
jgi:glycosyltransferase involved in cell wall biosynthesis